VLMNISTDSAATVDLCMTDLLFECAGNMYASKKT